MLPSIAIAVAAGCLLHVYTFVFKAEGGWSTFVAGLFAYSLTPYAVALILTWFQRARPAALGFAAGSLIGDIFMHYSVFIAPKGSTAALGLLFMPMWNLLLIGPLGAFVGWAIVRVMSKRSSENTA